MDILGMYPTFYQPWIGSAWVMGIIGTIHVVASHTSVGAAVLFALLESKSYRENRPELLDFIKRYGQFLLIFSYIIGSITGPGIWYAITLASPRGVAGLIHNFVWVWATEWVYFTVEVIGIYTLVYTIGKVDRRTHLKMTLAFALASWATMLLILGIISFMMWPGSERWYQTGSTTDAFYNLNFFAHLGIRTGSMLVMAAVVGLLVATRMPEDLLRRQVTRLLARVGLAGGFFAVMMFFWYLSTLPDNARVMLESHLWPKYRNGMLAVFLATVLYLLWAELLPRRLNTPVAALMLVFIALVGVWPEERMRESMRKPYVAGQYIYGNQVIARDVPGKGIRAEVERIGEHGFLELHPFVPERLRKVSADNRIEAGELLTKIACSNCHALEAGAPLRSLPDKLGQSVDVDLIAAFLKGPLAHGSVIYMPRIVLPPDEVEAIAAYLASQSPDYDPSRYARKD